MYETGHPKHVTKVNFENLYVVPPINNIFNWKKPTFHKDFIKNTKNFSLKHLLLFYLGTMKISYIFEVIVLRDNPLKC